MNVTFAAGLNRRIGMCALNNWHVIPCIAAIAELVPESGLMLRIAANGASDPVTDGFIYQNKTR